MICFELLSEREAAERLSAEISAWSWRERNVIRLDPSLSWGFPPENGTADILPLRTPKKEPTR
ncbi:hypothetical protein [Phyllobacterium lublinensis]|uniref:hypothetical protein n=1 Tax=Phyllobacterium lublinensis TaxID=2875708 RepID=UPI001CCDB3D3|nr:hypothetical protein [Phyllobacterium sp. 2063]MBZ9654678.1 hypothetical protein [Phyllobacterium sp. 2063]